MGIALLLQPALHGQDPLCSVGFRRRATLRLALGFMWNWDIGGESRHLAFFFYFRCLTCPTFDRFAGWALMGAYSAGV